MARIYETIFQHHDLGLASLASVFCFLACFILFTQITRPNPNQALRSIWIVAAAVVAGCGAWATELIAFLAFRPGYDVWFDVPGMTLSGLIAVLGSALGFALARNSERMALGGAIVGVSIAGMHFTGMAAMHVAATQHIDLSYFCSSLVFGASFATASLTRADLSPTRTGRLVSAALLSASILSMHFLGVTALSFTPNPIIVAPHNSLEPLLFSVAVTGVLALIATVGILGSLVDWYFKRADANRMELETLAKKLEITAFKANAANRAKTKFITAMSHELRTPLNSIIGFSELIKRDSDGAIGKERHHDYCSEIYNNGIHLLGMINDILDMSKLEDGNLEVHFAPVYLDIVINDCVMLMQSVSAKADVRLTMSIEDSLPVLSSDERRLRKIVLNLLSNAIKFTSAKGFVHVAAERSESGMQVRIYDNGIGMSEADISIALECFSQIDSKLSRKHEGAGIGLPLSKQLTELLGGVLKLESKPGVGTAVTIFFPAECFVSEAKAA